MRFEKIIDMPTATSGVWRRLGVHLFEGQLTVADMDQLEAAGDRWHASNPGERIVEMTVVYPSPNRLTGEERRRMARIIKRWQPVRDASATVILADGMTGAMQRSVLTGMMMLAPAPHPARVFGAIPPAVEWLARWVFALCGPDVERRELLAGVEQLCAEFRAKRDALAASGDTV